MSELKEINPSELRELLSESRQLIYKMPFQVPHDLIFLARAISLLSGLCTGLDPEINVWEQIIPYARRLLRSESLNFFQDGLSEVVTKVITESGPFLQKMISLPALTYSILEKLDQGNIAVRDPKSEVLLRGLVKIGKRMAAGVVFAAFLLSTVQLYLGEEELIAAVMAVFTVLALFWVILTR